ncbi:UNVERIFIED_CONTAM: Retrovirus-related Pol polyprotein from transposon RE2 [Sesamum radiatum]|uniref:Retrovirus-related Pol polyprotein from transposon RE2 n=1 Tax=Sesamum radiatum TaxID=300843 RepID=A0AAW2W0C1_SESRA
MSPPDGYSGTVPGHVCDSVLKITAVKNYLDSFFTIKDLGFAKYFLGLELARSTHGLLVTQTKYLTDILRDTHLLDAKTTSTPLPPGLKLTSDAGSLLPDPSPYRRLVGRLLYLGFTRPDVPFVVQQLSQFLQHPRSSHWDAAVHVLPLGCCRSCPPLSQRFFVSGPLLLFRQQPSTFDLHRCFLGISS